ncbi:aldehyde dehydrogenase family protein, partial [Enterobacter intestinihominis]
PHPPTPHPDTSLVGCYMFIRDSNISKALEYTDRLQAGTVWVNTHTLIDANLRFGGMKQSGTGRVFAPDWLDGWCETKWVCVGY